MTVKVGDDKKLCVCIYMTHIYMIRKYINMWIKPMSIMTFTEMQNCCSFSGKLISLLIFHMGGFFWKKNEMNLRLTGIYKLI